MSNIIQFENHNNISYEEIGTVSVSMFKNSKTGKPFFEINADNDDVLQLSYIIEDTLFNY